MRRVLLCTEAWPPAWSGGVQRPLKFAVHLRPLGYETTVLAPEIAPGQTLDPSLLEQAQDIPCHRVPVQWSWADRLPGTARRLVERWMGPALPDGLIRSLDAFADRARALHRSTPFDVVLTTSPPHSLALLGMRVKDALGLPWVADFRDEWSRNRLRRSRMTERQAGRDRQMERDAFRAADRILTTTGTMRDFVIASGVDPARVIALPNGFDEADLPPDVPHRYGERIVITYLGSLSSYRNLDPIFDAARRLRESNGTFPFEFRFITQASRALRHVRGYEDLVTEGIVRIEDHMAHRAALSEAKRADALLYVLSGATAENEPVAGKLFEYLALKRPILFVTSVRGENARILAEAGTGITVDMNDGPGIEKALRDLWRRWNDRALEVKPEGLERYSRRQLTLRLAKELEAVLS
ncbi:MAG TPA: glycosyltransferase [Candidatus Eisenbacteria bacterium]|nr:glycosyltransferase [Candidatus Eisenbacteria bacterium]